ncbi:mRNA turnover protein 4-like protein [Cryptotermes secundus]|uniref:Ribosome assembly factor mrt4 n=1 Tax=Cryptotermes secundus TaxID=105785 RepID=A0A2J7QLZ9_9NEOP|nr:mRNA turnover protein 4-like protein [Cryptotermes secundus]
MPKSKRDKKISLTKTKKKGLVFKQQLVDEIRKCVEDYRRIFVFSVQNMRNSKLKDLRTEWKHSRFFFGKNKVMALGLGKTKETEGQNKLHKLTKHLVGQCGLLFTNKKRDEVLEAGNLATETVTLPPGPLLQFPHSIEPHLRQLGMPTSLQRGVVTLLSEFTVCKADKALKPEQARILKLLGHEMAEFKITMKCMWSKDGKFKKFRSKLKKTPKSQGSQEVVVDVDMKDGDEIVGTSG